MGIYLSLARMYVLNRRKIQILSPDEGFQFAQKLLPRNYVTRDRAGFDQCCTLPILTDTLVIGERCGDGECRWSRGRIRPETEIGAKDVAIGRPLVENADEVSRHPNKKGLDAVSPAHRGPVWVVEKDQIDIAGVVELVSSELPHAEDDQSAVSLRLVGADQGGAALTLRLTQEVTHHRAERRLGKTAQRRCLLLERPGADELGHGGEKRHSTLGDPQTLHQCRRIFAKIFGYLGGSGDLGEDRVGAFLDDAGEEPLFPDRDTAQKRTIAENRSKQAFTDRRCAPRQCRAGVEFAFSNERLVPGFEAEVRTARIGRLGDSVTFGGEVR